MISIRELNKYFSYFTLYGESGYYIARYTSARLAVNFMRDLKNRGIDTILVCHGIKFEGITEPYLIECTFELDEIFGGGR